MTGVNLNGATVADAFGEAANLAGAAVNPAGLLQVDTVAPTIAGVTTTAGGGNLGAGSDDRPDVDAVRGGVTVSGGVPSLALNDGGAAVV